MLGSSNSLFSIIILIIPIVAVFYFISKKKKKKQGQGFLGMARKVKKDEVWQTVKKFLAQNNEKGKEVVYSFVAKRPNPLQEKKIRKIYTAQTQDYIKKNNLDKKAAKRYKAQRSKEASRELYCIYFISKNSKTQETDKPRIFEAEVVQKLTGVKNSPTKRVIVINGLKDFDTEFKWIEPLKKEEDQRMAKFKRQELAKEAKKAARKNKKSGRKVREAKTESKSSKSSNNISSQVPWNNQETQTPNNEHVVNNNAKQQNEAHPK